MNRFITKIILVLLPLFTILISVNYFGDAANLFSKRDIQSLLSLLALKVSIRLCAYPYNNRIRILLAAAGNTVPNDMAIGPAPWSKRIPISV